MLAQSFSKGPNHNSLAVPSMEFASLKRLPHFNEISSLHLCTSSVPPPTLDAQLRLMPSVAFSFDVELLSGSMLGIELANELGNDNQVLRVCCWATAALVVEAGVDGRFRDMFCCGFVLFSSWVVLYVLLKDRNWFWDSIEVEIEWETDSSCARKAR
ncbi:hypothetical protein Droror1_Dr00006509 [Drosera rotundifolia]